MLKVSKLRASIGEREILKGVDLVVGRGEIHVLMGPNGSGKSTLAQVIAGHPNYKIESGKLFFETKTSQFESLILNKLTPDKRAKMGIFLGFQHPVEVPGVSVFNFLRKAKNASGPVNSFPPASARSGLKSKIGGQNNADLRAVGNPSSIATQSIFREELKKYMAELKLPEDFLRRSLNEGFSGGEKKRNEILQMMALAPKLVILDEIDSGLDVDSLKTVASLMNRFIRLNPKSSILLITHYARILKYVKPDFVHVMVDGQIIKSGSSRLASEIERSGYERFQKSTVNRLQSTAPVSSQ